MKRAALESAKRRWLYRHRDIFKPLLPPSNTFFETVKKELDATSDKPTYVPLHQLDDQPVAIKGGTMKEYQVCTTTFIDRSILEVDFSEASRIVIFGVYVCKWWDKLP